MAIQVQEETEKLARRVVSMDWEGEQSRAVILMRVYATDINDLWQAIVNPERLQRWFAPISGDLREGGTYQLEGNAGGTIRQCDPPHTIAVTWEYGGDIGWVNIRLESVEERSTRLTIEHIAHEAAAFLEFWKTYGPGAVGVGWELGFLGLAQYLNSEDDSFSPFSFNEETWIASDAGKAFVRTSSDGWRDAEIEFGTEEEVARAAGEQTFAFYTGQSSEGN